MNYKHFTYFDRIRIESWLLSGSSVSFIAGQLGKSLSSVYRELRRGSYEHTLSDLRTVNRYSADLADSRYRENLKAKGPELKIGSDYALADYIEFRIHKCKYSPAAVLGEIKSKNLDFATSISKTTLYRYIDNNIFFRLTNKDLPIKRNKKKHPRKVRPARAPQGLSIEQRSDDVLKRNSFGHWEMDTVVGRKRTKPVLLVLTERLSRKELVYKIPDKSMSSVVAAVDRLQLRLGDDFRKVFKTITCDNGVEFSDYAGIKNDSSGAERVKVYYCHPYSSCERGSNENNNRLIRRHFPKGYDFTHTTKAEIAKVTNWINDYPREIFGWHSANEMFDLCLHTIGL